MVSISYVYPNLSPSHLKSVSPRGGLSERWQLATEADCKFIEIPGTLIKTKTEVVTTRNIGDFLTEREIPLLYHQDTPLPPDARVFFIQNPHYPSETDTVNACNPSYDGMTWNGHHVM